MVQDNLRRSHLRTLREQYKRNIMFLQVQAGKHGGESFAPLDIQNQLFDTRQELERIEEALAACEASVRPLAPPPARPSRPMRTIATFVGALRLILVEHQDDWLLAVENCEASDLTRVAITLVPSPDVLVSHPGITLSRLPGGVVHQDTHSVWTR